MPDENVAGILLVEDSPTTTEMVKWWLEEGLSDPFRVTAVDTLAGGLAALTENQIDLIVLDLNLPDCEGLETFRQFHAQAPEIPIVIMSGERDEQVVLEAVRLGAQDYIVKGSFDGVNPLTRPVLFAIERTRRQQSERNLQRANAQLAVANTIQQQMLPTTAPTIAGFEVAGRCDPAESVAGDYFDFYPIAEHKWGVLIGDVSGHGLGPALHMISTRGALRALMDAFRDTGTITTRANAVVHRDTQFGRFVTLMFVILDTRSRAIQFSSAGHPGYLFDANGDLTSRLVSTQPPLGLVADMKYEDYRTTIGRGGVVLLCTDGITEAESPDRSLFGEERLFEVIKTHIKRPASEIVNEVFEAVRAYRRSDVPTDDLTVVIVKSVEE